MAAAVRPPATLTRAPELLAPVEAEYPEEALKELAVFEQAARTVHPAAPASDRMTTSSTRSKVVRPAARWRQAVETPLAPAEVLKIAGPFIVS